MNTLDNLLKICNRFINQEFSVQEFQSRLETLTISDEYCHKLSKSINESVNRLEEIIFTASAENFYKYGVEVANKLIADIQKVDIEKF